MIPLRIRRMIDDCANYADSKKQFHPEPNVKNHLGQVVTRALEAGDTWEVCYAAMLHDIAKNTKSPKGWAEHAYRGSMMVAPDVTPKIRWLVEKHMLPYSFDEMRPHKLLSIQEHEWYDELMRLHNYDNHGRHADGVHMPWEDIFSAVDELDPRKNCVILMVGVQAAGKSTTSKKMVEASRDLKDWYKPEFERTSKDDIRLLLGVGPGGWRHQEVVANDIQRTHIRAALGRGQGVIIDNCHNTVRRRRDMREWLQQEFPGIRVGAHLVYAPIDVCLKRNKEEHGQSHRHRLLIPDKVLIQFHSDMVSGLGNMNDDRNIINNLMDEGFDEAHVTRTA